MEKDLDTSALQERLCDIAPWHESDTGLALLTVILLIPFFLALFKKIKWRYFIVILVFCLCTVGAAKITSAISEGADSCRNPTSAR